MSIWQVVNGTCTVSADKCLHCRTAEGNEIDFLTYKLFFYIKIQPHFAFAEASVVVARPATAVSDGTTLVERAYAELSTVLVLSVLTSASTDVEQQKAMK